MNVDIRQYKQEEAQKAWGKYFNIHSSFAMARTRGKEHFQSRLLEEIEKELKETEKTYNTTKNGTTINDICAVSINMLNWFKELVLTIKP